MAKFIDNVNAYLSQMKIKQTYLSMKTGIGTKKLSRILTGVQDVSSTDMELIAGALGQETAFFLSDSICIPQVEHFMPEKIAFYTGEPTERQEEIASKLVGLIKNIDEVLSSKSRFLNILHIYDLRSKEISLSCEELTDLIMKPNGISITF